MAFTEHCVIEVDDMVVEKMRRLGLVYLIDVPNMEFRPSLVPRLLRRPKRLETPIDIDLGGLISRQDERTP